MAKMVPSCHIKICPSEKFLFSPFISKNSIFMSMKEIHYIYYHQKKTNHAAVTTIAPYVYFIVESLA